MGTKNAQGLPVVYLHGLATSCEEDMKGSAFKAMRDESPYKNPVYCIEYGFMVNSVLRSMTYLTQKACKEFERHESKYNLKNGFILYGSSQGAMISRYIIEECSVGQYVKGFISSGGPHMGVVRLPFTEYKNYQKLINDLTDDVAYTYDMQHAIAPAGYFRSLRFPELYMDDCIFLPYINNEKNFNQQYKNRMAGLKFLLAIKYLKDEVVIPKESAHFGYFADKTETTIVNMEDTVQY